MIFLLAWSVVAFAWWSIALVLLARAGRAQSRNSDPAQPSLAPASSRPSVTIFKPLPPIRGEREQVAIAKAIAAFVSQLAPQDELIVGLNVDDEPVWRTSVQSWRESAPAGQIHIVTRPSPAQRANPKIAWLEVLSAGAKGELWLWSDADVSAPPDFLNQASAHLLDGAANAVTAPYCIRQVDEAKQTLDAIYVNLEFLPGALLLDHLKQRKFAYGAATLFRAATFRQRVDWKQLGDALADDYKLGEFLKTVALGPTMVSTFTCPPTWLAAWQHYYRWQKTVRWCQPGGYAALLVLMPLWGWCLAALLGVQRDGILIGLGVVLAVEVLVAFLACRLVGCRLPVRSWFGVLLWPFTRPIVWLLVWLPFPVLWTGRKQEWFAPVEK